MSAPVGQLPLSSRSSSPSTSVVATSSSSSPRLIAAVVEEAVSVGDLVRLLTFRQGQANLVELTLAADAPLVGQLVGTVPWPTDVALTAILREGRVIVPAPDIALEGGDELLLVATTEVEGELDRLLSGS